MNARRDHTLTYLTLIIIALIAVAYFTEQRLPPRVDNSLKSKYDSLSEVLQQERQANEYIIGEITRRQDTIKKLKSEIQRLQDKRVQASYAHITKSDSAILADIRTWANRYVLND